MYDRNGWAGLDSLEAQVRSPTETVFLVLGPPLTTRSPNHVLLGVIEIISEDLRNLSKKVRKDVRA
jgi:hypothetical protein